MDLPQSTFRSTIQKGLPYLVVFSVAALLLVWMVAVPAGLLGKADAVGYAVCHRIDVRSFHLGERQLPLCARCTGMYLGAAVGLVYQYVRSRRGGAFPPRRVWAVLALFLVAFGVDGLNSYLHLIPGAPGAYEPQNWLRLLTGTGMGIALAVLLYPSFNQTAWRNWQNEPAVRGLGELGILVLFGLVIDALVLWENPLVLYPLALISSATVLVLLTMVYTLVWLMILRRENASLSFRQMLLPVVGGFGMALLQIAILDLLRYALTGTWDGFHLG